VPDLPLIIFKGLVFANMNKQQQQQHSICAGRFMCSSICCAQA
jgi:hypothetical protein